MLKALKKFLPGIFLVGFCIGTGSVTMMATSGATYGYSLIWAIAISCLINYFMVYSFGKFTIVTGETAIGAFKKYIHPLAGMLIVISLGGCIIGSTVGVMGIITDVANVWTAQFIPGGISPIILAIIFSGVVLVGLFNGRMEVIQKILAILVGFMGIAFLLNFILIKPELGELAKGMIPSIPKVPTSLNVSPFLVIASMVGTTAFSGLFVMRSINVKEAKWTLQDLKHQQKDAMLAAIMLFIINVAIIGSSAGTLYKMGIPLERASQMVELLKPISGSFAVTLFVIGILSAGMSSQFPNVMFIPWLLSDYRGTERNKLDRIQKIIVAIMMCLGFTVPIFKASPIIVMIIASVFGSIVLPITVLFMMIVGNKKEIMKEYVFDKKTNIIYLLVFLFGVMMCINGIRGLILSLS